MKKFVFGLLCIGASLIADEALFHASILPITPEIFSTMQYSWRNDNPVPLDDLRCVVVSHWGYDNEPHEGMVVVHKIVAEEIVDIFDELYHAKFPIEKMLFVDCYQGIDELSAQDNNSYSFCSRPNVTRPWEFSKHSYGLAIDLNPLINPYHKGNLVIPETGVPYLDREQDVQGMIHNGDVCYNAFIKRGWSWGGDWVTTRGYADYQHFEKDPAVVLKGE